MSSGRCYADSSMLAVHHQPFNRKGRTFRDSTKNVLFYTTNCANDKEDLGLNGQQRSISLTTLHVGARSQHELLEPRMAQLETLEAKMASIEVSLSTTLRRKKGSSISGGLISPVNHRNKDHYKELDALRHALRDKENIIQTLKGQLCNTLSNRLTLCNGPVPLNEADRIATEERLQRLRRDADNKRMAIKNLKVALERLDITDNIDVRIQQAELEYRLGREELELLSLREESRALQAAMELAEAQKKQKNDTIFSCISGPTEITVHAVELSADPKSPRFGAGPRDDSPGLYVDWALDDSGLFKGDRIIEVNGKLVVGANRTDLARLLAVAPDAAQIVVLRKGESLGTLRTLRSDNLRLTHRIGYLEEQVRDLVAPSRTDQLCDRPSSRQEHLQVFQKGPQVTTLIRKSPCIETAKMSNLREGQPEHAEIDFSSDGVFTEYHKSKSRAKRQAVHLTRSTISLDCKHSPNTIQCLAHAELQMAKRMTGLESATPVERRKTGSHLHSLEFDSEPTYYRVHYDAFKCRPAPPKKPLRLSLHRASSLQSVESALPTTVLDTGRKPIKRNYRGDPPTEKNLRFEPNDENSREHPTQQCNIPQSGGRAPSRAESCQSALRWPSPKARSHFTPVSIDKWR